VESVLDKLRTKYIHLRHKYDKLVANESKEQSTFGTSTLAGAATLNTSSVPTACLSGNSAVTLYFSLVQKIPTDLFRYNLW